MCQHKGIKPSHWIPIASSHAVQTRFWIVIYIKCQHPGSIWPLLFNLPLAQGRLALLTLAHWWTPKSAFMYLKGASLFWAEGSVSLLAAVSDGSSFCTPSPSYRASTVKWKRTSRSTKVCGCPLSSGVTEKPLRVLGMLLLPGDEDALWFRAQKETGQWEEELESQHSCSLIHPSGSWYPQGSTQGSRVVTTALRFVAAGPISERERKMPSVNV